MYRKNSETDLQESLKKATRVTVDWGGFTQGGVK
jgi:hypothetical protein